LEVVLQTDDAKTDAAEDNTSVSLKKIHQVLWDHCDAVFQADFDSEGLPLPQTGCSLELALHEQDISSFAMQVIAMDLTPWLCCDVASTNICGILGQKAILPAAMFVLSMLHWHSFTRRQQQPTAEAIACRNSLRTSHFMHVTTSDPSDFCSGQPHWLHFLHQLRGTDHVLTACFGKCGAVAGTPSVGSTSSIPQGAGVRLWAA